MFDTSTLNQEALRRLPPYTPPPTYRVDNHLGSACYGDPPGFPTYFLRHVYTSHGNTPPKGPDAVIEEPRTIADQRGTLRRIPEISWGQTNAEGWENRRQFFTSLWLPLPYEHPRVQAWIVSTYIHHHHCYMDLDQRVKAFEYGTPAMLIYPDVYGLRTFQDDPRFSDEWRTKEREAVAQFNAELLGTYEGVCIPERHSAYLIVKRYYPEHTPDLDLIAQPPKQRPGDWWETEDRQPTPEECTGGRVVGPQGLAIGYRGISGSGHVSVHPLNGSWCQWCGWTSEQ